MATNTWTADRRLYLDKDGKAVEADNPARVRLLVAVGGTIPVEEAQRLGLIAPPEEKMAAPHPNKLRVGAGENKGEVPGRDVQFAERPEGADPGVQEDGQGLPPVAEEPPKRKKG